MGDDPECRRLVCRDLRMDLFQRRRAELDTDDTILWCEQLLTEEDLQRMWSPTWFDGEVAECFVQHFYMDMLWAADDQPCCTAETYFSKLHQSRRKKSENNACLESTAFYQLDQRRKRRENKERLESRTFYHFPEAHHRWQQEGF